MEKKTFDKIMEKHGWIFNDKIDTNMLASDVNEKVDWDKLQDVDRSRFVEMAERNVKLSLILDRIRENEPEAQVSDQEVFEIIKQNIAHSQMPQSPDEIIKKMNETGYLQILFSRIKDEYALDFIAKTVKFVE